MGSSQRILVVDDDQTILNLVKITLEHEGYDVILAQDGQIALDHYRKDQIDLAIVDIAMPVMDGYEVIQEMQKLTTQSKRVPIVILSAHDQEVMRDYATERLEQFEQLDQLYAAHAQYFVDLVTTRMRFTSCISIPP